LKGFGIEKNMVHFMAIWNMLWPFGLIYGRLVYFVVIWYIFTNLVCLDQDKSGNPDHVCNVIVVVRRHSPVHGQGRRSRGDLREKAGSREDLEKSGADGLILENWRKK
jgi:hypothetical protein